MGGDGGGAQPGIFPAAPEVIDLLEGVVDDLGVFDPRYKDVPPALLPETESLKDTVERILPYWKEEIFPSLTHIDQILVTAHGNSLRGIIKYLKNISDEDIVGLNLPTAVPYVFDFDNDLRLINDYFLGDPEEIKKLMEAVAKQGQKK